MARTRTTSLPFMSAFVLAPFDWDTFQNLSQTFPVFLSAPCKSFHQTSSRLINDLCLFIKVSPLFKVFFDFSLTFPSCLDVLFEALSQYQEQICCKPGLPLPLLVLELIHVLWATVNCSCGVNPQTCRQCSTNFLCCSVLQRPLSRLLPSSSRLVHHCQRIRLSFKFGCCCQQHHQRISSRIVSVLVSLHVLFAFISGSCVFKVSKLHFGHRRKLLWRSNRLHSEEVVDRFHSCRKCWKQTEHGENFFASTPVDDPRGVPYPPAIIIICSYTFQQVLTICPQVLSSIITVFSSFHRKLFQDIWSPFPHAFEARSSNPRPLSRCQAPATAAAVAVLTFSGTNM